MTTTPREMFNPDPVVRCDHPVRSLACFGETDPAHLRYYCARCGQRIGRHSTTYIDYLLQSGRAVTLTTAPRSQH